MLARDEGREWRSAPDRTADVPPERRAEYEGLVRFLLAYAHDADATAPAIAHRIARAALREGHLWRAMDLPSRGDLSTLFERHFRQLKHENHRDMRWKKFLYRRLCGWGGFSH